jgi:hypothetical protein
MPSISTAVKHLLSLIEEKIDTSVWMHWRVDKLWCNEVSDFFESNKSQLMVIYKSYCTGGARFMNQQDAIDLVINKA